MEINAFNRFVLCYKYTISKLFYGSFMMNVIDRFQAFMIGFGPIHGQNQLLPIKLTKLYLLSLRYYSEI